MRERLVADFMGGVVQHEILWVRDEQGRVLEEIRSDAGYSNFGIYDSAKYTYGPFGIASMTADNAQGGFDVRYDYDAQGRHLTTKISRPQEGYETLTENAYAYDEHGRVVRWRNESRPPLDNRPPRNERRYAYGCGVDANQALGRDVPFPTASPP